MPVVIMVAASALAAWRVAGIGLDPRRMRFAAALAAAFAVVVAPSVRAKLREPVYRLLPPIAHEQAQETLPVP